MAERRRSPSSDALGEYQAKRDFSVTPEPSGVPAGSRRTGGNRFVVQRHRARRLHYDFRLEIDGVLVSWALPKGPSLDPSTRNLAVHVEDHPLEYGDFEGVIPKGEYGGGDVIVWDRGTWTPSSDDPAAEVERGELHFDLDGEKLKGRFVLVHTRREGRGEDQWLMLHKHDEHAQDGWDPEAHPASVKSGRTNEEVAAAPDAMWRSDLPPTEAEIPVERAGAKGRKPTKPTAAAATTVKKAKATPSKARSKVHPKTRKWTGPTVEELAALEAMGDKGLWELQGVEVSLTNLGKELFPGRGDETPITKRDLIRYYTSMAPVILPYLADRPLNMNRFPNGSASAGFWHKEVPKHAPDWLTRWRNPGARKGESEYYAIVDSAPALAWMANYAAVELHPWTSRIPEVRQPTWAFIDIDPGEKATFDEVLVLARLYRTALDHLGVVGKPKLTGRRGIHVWVPVAPGYSFDDTRQWVEKVSRAVGGTVPDLVSWTWTKRERKGLARLDYTQNALNKTLVAPYSLRAAPGTPVSVPVEWDELDSDLLPDSFGMRQMPERLADAGDPFAELSGLEQRLPDL